MEVNALLAIAARSARTAFFALAASAACAQPLAIVIELQGRAVFESPGPGLPLELLSELREGARVRLEGDARAVALYLSSGAHYDLAGPGQVEFPAGGPSASGGATVLRRPVVPGREIRLRPTGLAQGGLIVRSGGLRPVAPMLVVLENSPAFSWHDLRQDVRYRFTLAEESGAAVFETETDARSLQLPRGIVLQPGIVYRWRVVPTSGEGRAAEAAFRVADDDLRRRTETLRPAAGAPFPDRVAYALWLEEAGLRGEAFRLWRDLAAARPGDPVLRSRAARGS
jgi:hypothetical protein